MGGRIRHTKLNKVNHPYDLEANGKKYTVMITKEGKLQIYTDKDQALIMPYSKVVGIDQG